MDVTKAEDIKKRWQEYTEELYKKGLNDMDNCNDVVTHLEPDILEYEIKWTLGSITMDKASGGDGIPAELFKMLKNDAIKELNSISANLENSAVALVVNNPPANAGAPPRKPHLGKRGQGSCRTGW